MSVGAKFASVEAKMFLREPMAWTWGLVFPSLLVVVLGCFYPGFLDPTTDLDGRRPIDVYTPIVIVLGIATMGVATMPAVLASYRERRMLRRLRTTPGAPGSGAGRHRDGPSGVQTRREGPSRGRGHRLRPRPARARRRPRLTNT